MTIVKITMPTKDGKLVDWEDCVIAYREKEKRRWRKRRAFPSAYRADETAVQKGEVLAIQPGRNALSGRP